MELADARRHVWAWVRQNDSGEPRLAPAQWGWTDGHQWLVLTDTPRALRGYYAEGIMDPPWYIVGADGNVEPVAWNKALELQDAWRLEGTIPRPKLDDTLANYGPLDKPLPSSGPIPTR